MKKRSFFTILMVAFAFMLSSNLFSQIENEETQASLNETTDLVEDGGEIKTTSVSEVEGVFVPD